ncbi:hypothetical protein F3H11_34440 [Pseudomonas aeruginosa]|nr:hypothetical protein F3H11_34440 [Pseudomonas aeruginosa]
MLIYVYKFILELIKSYLSRRIQKVDVKGKRSSGVLLNMGVPQGSILGPFLFLVLDQ